MRNYRCSLLVLTVVGSAAVFGGCADSKESTAARGVLAKIETANGPQLKVLAEGSAEAKEVCRTNFCEPNYVYYANFGRRRPDPSPPQPTPPPRPTPVPGPGPGPDPTTEFMDYSRGIMDVAGAWAVTEGSRDVIVAIVDTGMQVDHPDLRDNVYVNQAEANGRPGVDDDGNGFVDDVYGWDFANNRPNAIDDQKHGTHCAGIIGGEKNGFGTVGVSPKVKMMPVKFLGADGSGSLDAAIKAIDYAVANGARVISNSWGGGGFSQLLQDAIQRALNKGIIVVAAAGNETNNNDSNPSYPASYPGVLAVASTDAQDNLSSFSNYGRNSVAIAAPGSNIYSSVIGSRYEFLSGTSMATPQVSGALALGLSLNKNLSASDLRNLLCATSDRILTTRVQCGRMNVGAFVREVSKQ